MTPALAALWGALLRAFRSPTPKQMESYGRFCHTLAAAAFIAGVTLALTSREMDGPSLLRIAAALFWALILFCSGALFLEGD